MKINEIRELSVSELLGRVKELKEEIFHLRLQQQSGQLEKPSQIRMARKEIARIETVLTIRSAEAAKAQIS